MASIWLSEIDCYGNGGRLTDDLPKERFARQRWTIRYNTIFGQLMHLVHLFIGLFICSFSSLTLFRCHTQCSNWFESKHPIYYGNTVGKKQWLMCTGNGQWPIVTLSHNMNVQWMQTINDRRPLLQWSFHKEWNVYILSVCMYIVPLRTIVDSDHCNCNHCQVHLWKPIDAWTCMYIFTTIYIYATNVQWKCLSSKAVRCTKSIDEWNNNTYKQHSTHIQIGALH